MNEPKRPTARAVLQYLQDLQRAGITVLPRLNPEISISDDPQSRLAAIPIPTPSADSQSNPIERSASPVTKPLDNQNIDTDLQPKEVLEETQSMKSSEERLAALAKRVAACTRCEQLATARTQTVFGVGDPNARMMFIGEAPGADEDRLGEPFVGRAGQLLDRIIAACQMSREEIYICNILRCRPPGNRNPFQQEADNCREYLNEQIQIVNPEYIVCWGTVAAQNLLGVNRPIGKMRKQFFQFGNARVVCTYHPSYLLRNPPAKKDVWEDMKFLFADMGINLKANQ